MPQGADRQLRITIGVPVYNGEAHLDKCLASLAAQTSNEFEVLVLDNDSTDRTPEIIQSYVERYPFFRSVRQPQKVGVTQNFVDVIGLAQTPYFAWRAYDDFSSPNWVENLVRILDEAPHLDLAVCSVRSLNAEGVLSEPTVPIVGPQGPMPDELPKVFGRINPSWIYGLFRREAALSAFLDIRRRFPYVWALDMLILLKFVIDRSVGGTGEAEFTAIVMPRSGRSYRPNHFRDAGLMRRNFLEVAMALLDESNMTAGQKAKVRRSLRQFAGSVTEKPRRIWRGAVSYWLGLGDGRVRPKEPLRRITPLDLS